MNRTIMICLSVLLVALGLTACAQAVSKAAAEQSTVPSAADSTEQNVLPENTEPPAPEMIDFEVNRYAVTAGAAAYLDGAEEQYKALVDAVCSKKETEPYTDEDAAKRAAEVFAETPYSALAEVTAKDSAFQITYTGNGDADTFDAAIKALVESCVYKDANEAEKALSLYRTVASEFAQEGGENGSLYKTVTEQKGSAEDLANALTYLFVQNGISADRVSGMVGESERSWTAAELSGNRYHFDAAAEKHATDGHGLQYFGMSDEARSKAGSPAPYTIGEGGYAVQQDTLSTDTKFDAVFADVKDFTVDVYGHFVYLSTESSEDGYQNSIGTESFTAAVG